MYLFLKRILDVFLALIMLLILSPVFIFIGLILTIHFRKSPFFIQSRSGLNGKSFNLIKFQTMRDLRDSKGTLLADNERISALGHILRKFSLDELPQIFNVLKGDMSFVGPRPLLIEYLNKYSDYQRQRLDVLPGITGWAQVNGRNSITWEEKFKLDVSYVKNKSFLFDFYILLMTVLKVFRAKDIQSSDVVTMEKFKG